MRRRPTLDREAVRAANRLEDVIPELTDRALSRNGTRELVMNCLWHDDHDPSLRVNVEKQVWRCDPCNIGGDVFAFVERLRGVDFRTALEELAERASLRHPSTPQRRIVATYDYCDTLGTVRHQTVRWAPKAFSQRRPDGKRGWISNLDGVDLVLYRLPDLIAAVANGREEVAICAGEKDVDALWTLGIAATTNALGEGKWKDPYTEQLLAIGFKRAVVFPDNDTTGHAHGDQVARSCHAGCLAVRVVQLPDVPAKGDVSDYLGAHTKDDLLAVVRAARIYEPPAPSTEMPNHDAAPSTFNLTDSGNAEYFAARHRRDVRYDHRRARWLLWRQHRWQLDADAEIRRLAKAAMRQRFRDAATLEGSDARSRAAKSAIASESRSRLDALLYLAQAESPVADAGDGWDSDPMLLGVPNGVVDLRSGELRAGRRDDRITLAAGVAYDPEAHSDLWEHALQTILLDQKVIDFFHVAIGYSATGDMRRDCWFLGWGSGRNGKGTVYNPIRRALGDYALELPAAVFDLRTDRSPYELAYLPGKRFVTSSESGDTIRLNHDRVKQLTGGDPVSAANKYEKAFEFEPACKLWLACNKKPRVTDDSPAFWARVVMIPFTVSFAGREDRDLRPTLEHDSHHQAAVLAWIVRGAVRYHAEGLSEPPAVVRAATAAYREDSDPLAAFLDEVCELEPVAEVGANELYEHYVRWADGQHFIVGERLSATMFGRLMGAKFESQKDRKTGVKHYRGIARRRPS